MVGSLEHDDLHDRCSVETFRQRDPSTAIVRDLGWGVLEVLDRVADLLRCLLDHLALEPCALCLRIRRRLLALLYLKNDDEAVELNDEVGQLDLGSMVRWRELRAAEAELTQEVTRRRAREHSLVYVSLLDSSTHGDRVANHLYVDWGAKIGRDLATSCGPPKCTRPLQPSSVGHISDRQVRERLQRRRVATSATPMRRGRS